MLQMTGAEDVAIEAAAQTAPALPAWVPVGISVVALLIAVAAAWINWRAASPRLKIEFDHDAPPVGGSLSFIVTNIGRSWVDDIQIKWLFDPMELHHHPDNWKKDHLQEGESFKASLSNWPHNTSNDIGERFQEDLRSYEYTFFGNKTARRFGVATYKRQIYIPFIRTRQRVALPECTPEVMSAYAAHARAADPDTGFA